MNTDTNQASEDELRVKVYNEIKLWLSPHESLQFIDDFMPIITSLIRTEKLKLLAEVRERVIGEDLPPDVATDSGIGYSRQQFAINMGKAGQRKALNKLEAEL